MVRGFFTLYKPRMYQKMVVLVIRQVNYKSHSPFKRKSNMDKEFQRATT